MAVATREAPRRTTPPPRKRPNGAPQPAAQIPGAELASAQPFSPSEIPPGIDFWDYLSGFTSEDWKWHIGYLWMTSPFLDLTSGGKPKSVDKYSRPFDLQLIKEEHGSADYRIDFCRIAQNGNKQQRIHQEYFGIFDERFPPKIPYGDWLTWPQNAKWAWAAPYLKNAQTAAVAAAEGKATMPDGTALFNTILNGVRELRGDSGENEGLASAVLEMVRSDRDRMLELSDPTRQLATIKGLMKELAPPPDQTSSLIIQMMRDELKETRAELRALRDREAQPRPDLITQLIDNAPKLKDAFALFGLGGAAGRGSGTDWGAVISESVAKLSENVPVIVEAWKFNKTNQATAPSNTQPWRPGVVTDQPAAAAIPAATTAAPGAAATAAPPPAPAEDATEEQRIEAAKKKMAFAEQKYGTLIKAVAPILVDNFRAGMTGYDFRDWFIDRQGRNNWVSLRDEVGAETFTQLAMSHPMLKIALQPPEKLYGFLIECFTAPGEENADRLSPAPGTEDEPENDEAIRARAEQEEEERLKVAPKPELVGGKK